MIRYLQKLRASKGFTMAELVIVIAIMAILMAMILPAFSSDDAEKQAAETYASDFYASLQYNMTRYQLTEFHLTPELQTIAKKYDDGDDVEPYIIFRNKLGGNVFTTTDNDEYRYLYVEVAYDGGIEHVKVAHTFADLIDDTVTTPSDDAFEKLLQNDLEDVLNAGAKGYYYAVVRCDYKFEDNSSGEGGDAGDVAEGHGHLRVMSAHYCDERIPADAVKADLQITDFSELKNGIICGTCSSDKSGTSYVGTVGTYLLNINSMDENAIIE